MKIDCRQIVFVFTDFLEFETMLHNFYLYYSYSILTTDFVYVSAAFPFGKDLAIQ